MDVERLLREGYTDSEIKKILRPTIKVLFNPTDFKNEKEYRQRVERESYSRISAARKKIKNEKKIMVDKRIREVKKEEKIEEGAFYTTMIVGGREIRVKVA